MVSVTSLIDRPIAHAQTDDITGHITDVVLAADLSHLAFLLVAVETQAGRAPLLFSPTMVFEDDGVLKTSAHPDDILARVEASLARTDVAVNPADLPSVLIGPFGNAVSPSLLAALFNNRSNTDRPELPDSRGKAIWFLHLRGTPVWAHLAHIGAIHDFELDEDLAAVGEIILRNDAGKEIRLPPSQLESHLSAEGKIVVTYSETPPETIGPDE